MAGDYAVRVLSANAGAGEYVLSVGQPRVTVAVPADAVEDAVQQPEPSTSQSL